MAAGYGTSLENVSTTAARMAPSQKILAGSTVLTESRAGYSHRSHGVSRVLRNRGAILVLVLSFCAFSIFHFLVEEEYNYERQTLLTIRSRNINPVVLILMCFLFYPVFGWLADVYYGRYKVIKWSLWLTLIGLCLLCLASALSSRLREHQATPIRYTLYLLITLGVGGFQANIIQFSIDQFADAPSTEIKSFLHWYLWLHFTSGMVVKFAQSCICSDYYSLGLLLLPALVTLAVCLDILFNHWLVKEPTSPNPLTLIFKVLRYAAKNKYPRLRNAFSYWDNRQYSRIDLAKTKFGGPFTTEQVEDVKTFFRIVSVLITGAVFLSFYMAMNPIFDKMLYRLNDPEYQKYEKHNCPSAYTKNCFQRTAVSYSGGVFMVIALPLFEFALYPCFRRYFHVSTLKKVIAGMILYFITLATCAAIEFAAQQVSYEPGQNVTQCQLHTKVENMHPNVLRLDYKWMILSYLPNFLAQYILLTSIIEFLCAQSPYSMKGLLFGFAYGSAGFFTIVGNFLLVPVQLVAVKKFNDRHGCMFWYIILGLGILVTLLLLLTVVIKCYKRRPSRTENYDTEH